VHDSRRGSGSHVGSFKGERSLHNAPSLHTGSSVRNTPSPVRHTPSALSGIMPGVSLSSVVRAGGTLPPLGHEMLEPLEPPSLLTRIWRGQPWLVGTAFAAVFIATTMAVALHRPAPPPPEPIVPAPAAAVAAPVPRPAAPETIVFSVSVAPSSAQISIDGQPMPSNPFVGHFAKTGGTHRVRATAPGHQPKERLVSFDDNVMIDLSLTPAPPSPQPPAHASTGNERAPSRHWEPRHSEPPARHDPPPPPQQAPSSVSTPSLAPAPVAAPSRRDSHDIVPRGEWEPPRKRTIDTSNPYGDEK